MQNSIHILLRDHPAFLQDYREYAKGGGKSSCTLSKMLVLATVPVHETSLANQHFNYSTFLEGRRGYVTLCTLVKMLKIMDGPLITARETFMSIEGMSVSIMYKFEQLHPH